MNIKTIVFLIFWKIFNFLQDGSAAVAAAFALFSAAADAAAAGQSERGLPLSQRLRATGRYGSFNSFKKKNGRFIWNLSLK